MHKYIFFIRFENLIDGIPSVDSFLDVTSTMKWTRQMVDSAEEFGINVGKCLPLTEITGMLLRAKCNSKIHPKALSIVSDVELVWEDLNFYIQSLDRDALKKFIESSTIKI